MHTNNSSDVVTILPECNGCIGILETVGFEDGTAIAQINGKRYETPADMFDEFRDLVGQHVIIACIAGQVRVGRFSTTPTPRGDTVRRAGA